MIKLSEKDMLKIEVGQKLGLLCQTAKLGIQRKSPTLEIKGANPVNKGMTRK